MDVDMEALAQIEQALLELEGAEAWGSLSIDQRNAVLMLLLGLGRLVRRHP